MTVKLVTFDSLFDNILFMKLCSVTKYCEQYFHFIVSIGTMFSQFPASRISICVVWALRKIICICIFIQTRRMIQIKKRKH